MQWFTSESELSEWSGPNFRFPFNLKTFKEDLKLDSINSYFLIDKNTSVVAFGQYYQRLGKCHLGRLVVNPEYRGKGYAAILISELIEVGLKELNVKDSSLFVLKDNKSAIIAYEKQGFIKAIYPEKMPLKDCYYMVKA